METFTKNIKELLVNDRIILYSGNEFEEQFLCEHIETLEVGLCNENNDHNISWYYNQYLLGKRYEIIIGGSMIYSSTIQEGNIFPRKNVPLHLLQYHKVLIVIYDVKVPNLNDYYFCIKLKKSNLNANDSCQLEWSPFGAEKINYLRFAKGMAGQLLNSLVFPKDYLNKNMISNEMDGFKVIKINHFDENNNFVEFGNFFHNEYDSLRTVATMIDNKSTLVMETIKMTERNVINTATFCLYCNPDSLTNFEILCEKNVKLKRVKIRNFGDISFKETSKGYKFKKFNDMFHLIVVGYQQDVFVEIEFDSNSENNNITLKCDRVLFDSAPRKVLAYREWEINDDPYKIIEPKLYSYDLNRIDIVNGKLVFT